MSKSTSIKKFLSSFLIFSIAFLLTVSAEEKPQQPSVKQLVPKLYNQLRVGKAEEKQEALETLLKLEKETSDAKDLCSIYELLIQYGTDKTVYAQKIFDSGVASVLQKTRAYNVMRDKVNYVSRFREYYLTETIDKKDMATMEQEEIRILEELLKLNPDNASFKNALGNAYVLLEDPKKAENYFATVLATHNDAPRKAQEASDAVLAKNGTTNQAANAYNTTFNRSKVRDLDLGDALLGLANVAILKNEIPKAVEYCRDLVSRDLNTRRAWDIDTTLQAKLVVQYLEGYKLDNTHLPIYTDAKVFPTPKRAEYSEEFVTLKTVSLQLPKGMKDSDPPIQFLQQKFKRLGIEFDKKAPFTIKINSGEGATPPEKSEGYSLSVSKSSAQINGNDKLGTLWGIVSLIQVINPDTSAVRICTVLDYPDTNKRGFLERYWDNALEFMLFAKMNSTTAQIGVQLSHNEGYRPWTPLEKAVTKETAKQFNAFGFDHYFGIRGITMHPKMPLSSERTMDLLVERCSFVAAAGGHIYFPYDDCRYPVHEKDLEKYGNASKMDAIRIDTLFRKVREKYPDFKLVFCPPFYAVPDGMDNNTYPDSRDDYLASIGEHMHPDLQIYWTGPRVAGLAKPRSTVKFMSKLIKRDPAIFQNRVRPHNHLSYITDTITGWSEWHYDGFVENDITMFHKNGCANESTLVLTLSDYLWHTQAYDADRSIREATAMLYGKEMFDILDPGTQAMTELDKYVYGNITPEALNEVEKIEKCYNIAKECYEKGLAYNSFTLNNYPASYGRGVGFAKKALDSAKDPPDFFTKFQKDIEETRAIAEEEVGIDEEKGDIFKSPIDFYGGKFIVYSNRCPKRFANLMYGALSPAPKVTAHFECYPFPPEGDYMLIISGQQEPVVGDDPCAIRIAINGKVIFEGPSKFVHNGWSIEEFRFPIDYLVRNNTITIENIEDASNPQGPPWFMINYGVIKKVPAAERK